MLSNPKKVKFHSVYPQFDVPKPGPSYKVVPSWYREMEGVEGTKMTIKKCVPFLDALTSGYTISLAADTQFTADGFVNLSKADTVSLHHPDQISGVPIPPEYSTQPYKWENFFIMSTPKGYSTMFVHPMNRLDLPFFSLSGIVDTDKHPVPVNFPFLIRKDFRGVVPAGTPIIQAIPFKRDSWEAKVDDTSPVDLPVDIHLMHNPPFGYYKKHWWSKKTYR
jgi:hypothetical protein